MRALVTGGAGFIGSALVDRLLAEGHAVDVVDDLSTGTLANLAAARAGRHDLSFHQLDSASPDLAELAARRRPDVVYHLATRADLARSVADPVGDASATVLGALGVLEAARRCEAEKVVVSLSGAAIYGRAAAGDLPLRESSPQLPHTPHGAAEKAVVEYLRAYRELHQLEYSALALATVYGPRQDPAAASGVVAAFAGRLLDGQACTVHGGGQTRDLVYVDDVVDALARAATRGGGLLLNVGTGVETTIAGLYLVVADAVGSDAPALRAPARPGDLRRTCLDPSRAGIHLGWRPWTALADGVAATVAWARAQRD